MTSSRRAVQMFIQPVRLTTQAATPYWMKLGREKCAFPAVATMGAAVVGKVFNTVSVTRRTFLFSRECV